jgi:hypothetical protein
MTQFDISFNDVIKYQKYFNSLKKCNNEVNFKHSVQSYNSQCCFEIDDTIKIIMDNKIPNVKPIHKVKIYERGKKRIITPIDIADRTTQKVLCENVLIPSITPHLIYDNGASMEGKGTEFARKRMGQFIESAKRRWGADNLYVLVFDFKSYFDNVPHAQCYRVLKKYISDPRLVNLIIGIIESYQLQEINKIQDKDERNEALRKLYNHEMKGICLGSQISQIMAVAVPNDFDHYIKDVLRMKYYIRYMDDGVTIFNNKKKLLKFKEILGEVAKQYGLTFNTKKTYVTKLSKGFTFLKVKYRVDEKGRTIKKLVRSGTVRERRKLKCYVHKVENKEMSLDDVFNNIQSWNAHSKIAKSSHTVKSMFKLYNDLYGGYRMTYKYYKEHPEVKRKRKVVRL